MFKKCFIRQCLFWSFAVFFASSPKLSYANDPIAMIERPDNELLILGLEVNGYLRNEGIEAYLPVSDFNNDILIPLGILSNALSISIKVNPAEGLAEGFFLEEDKVFQLDMSRGEVIYGGQSHQLPKEGVEAHLDDIYVALPLLEEWFNIDIAFQSFSLVLTINSETPFPFQEADEREKRSHKLLAKSRKEDFDPKKAYFIPYGYFSKPSVVLQKSLTGTKTIEENSFESTSNIQAGFDLLKFGANLNITHVSNKEDKSKFKNASFTLSRSDPKRELLGPLKAGRISIGDIDFPDVPLIASGGRGSGISISSEADFGYKLSQQLGVIVIDGDAPVNWDVELYRNGQFIGFQQVDTDARFKFEDIQLISGFNRFKIILFGPEGQERTVTRDILSGPNMLSKGALKYSFSVGKPEADFLPLVENSQDNTNIGGGAEILYGVTNFLTIGANVFSGPNGDNNISSESLSVSAAYLGFNAQVEGAIDDQERTVLRTSLRKRFFGINAAAEHIEYNNFDNEDDKGQENSTELSLSRNLGKANVTLIGKKENFIDKAEDKTAIENIVSSDIAGIRFTNQITKTISNNEQVDDLKGELSVFTNIKGFRFRSSLAYDLDSEAEDKLQTLRINAQKQIREKDSLRINGNYNFPTNIAGFDARYSREFDPVTLDFNIGGSTTQSYFAGVTARVSLQPRVGGYKAVSSRTGTLGSLGIRAFIDENNNSIFDTNEEIIENVVFKSSSSVNKARTDKDGVGWLYGLAELPTRISVDIEKIPSIYIVPAKKGLDLIPRRGNSSIVDYPFIQFGEVDGYVLDKSNGEPLSNITVKIVNVKTKEIISEIQSEYDGFFVFSSLPLGEYKVIASSGWFEEGALDTDINSVNLTTDDSYISGLILKISDNNTEFTEDSNFIADSMVKTVSAGSVSDVIPKIGIENKIKNTIVSAETSSPNLSTTLENIRFGEHDDYTRIVLDLSEKLKIYVFLNNDLNTLLITLPEMSYKIIKDKNLLSSDLIHDYEIETSPSDEGNKTIISIALKNNVNIIRENSYFDNDSGFKYIIDITDIK